MHRGHGGVVAADQSSCSQWHTQKIFMVGFYSVTYGSHLFVVCGLCDVTI